MNIILMRTVSEPNKVYKSLTTLGTYECVLKDEVNIINPVINIAGIDSLMADVNYAYIPQFNRYYYVDSITSLNTGLLQINLTVDVLQSFADDIMNNTAIIERQQFDYDMELRDTNIPTYVGTLIQYTSFPSGFTDYQIVIPILGN